MPQLRLITKQKRQPPCSERVTKNSNVTMDPISSLIAWHKAFKTLNEADIIIKR